MTDALAKALHILHQLSPTLVPRGGALAPSKQRLFTSTPLHTEVRDRDLPLFADQATEHSAGAAKAGEPWVHWGTLTVPVVLAGTQNAESLWVLGLHHPREQDCLLLCCASVWEVDSH